MRRSRLFGESRVTWGRIKAVAVLGVFATILSSLSAVLGLLFFVGIGWGALLLAHFAEKRSERSVLLNTAQQHLRHLSAKHAALESRNGYGAVHPKEWTREVNRFLDTTGVSLRRLPRAEAHALVTALVVHERQHGSYAIEEQAWRSDLDAPLAFERRCAARLEALGWKATLTPKSGDQGIDVLARRGQVVAVLQCKLYSQPVGNSAVQQVLGGKHWRGADLAAVVTNASFTKSAHDLAACSGVLLLHYSELDRLNSAVGGPIERKSIAPQRQPLSAEAAVPASGAQRGLLGNYARKAKARMAPGRDYR